MSTCDSLDYPIELHYSQTLSPMLVPPHQLDYPIELHYSQTVVHPEAQEVLA